MAVSALPDGGQKPTAVIVVDVDVLEDEKALSTLRERWPDTPVLCEETVGGGLDSVDKIDAKEIITAAYKEKVRAWERHAGATVLESYIRHLPPQSKVAIFCHDNPDPDALASALAMHELVAFLGHEPTIYHGGLIEQLRYGENPHQQSAIYSNSSNINLKQIHGKQLSYNNYNDIFSALTISRSLPKGKGTVIVKHANPCGVSTKNDHFESYKSALSCDPVSAFGGIVSCNFKITKNLALELNKLFLEVIIANGFESSAIKILKAKKNLRLIDGTNYTSKEHLKFVSFSKDIMVQSEDLNLFSKKNFKIVSKKKPTSKQLKDLIFAFNVCRYVKSNAIVLASNETTVGIGSGQPSRLDSCQIAINKMKKFNLQNDNLVAASDAFFPFVDGIEKLVQSGVRAVVQPSGSIRDKEIISFANDTGIVLLFSKTRHFRH